MDQTELNRIVLKHCQNANIDKCLKKGEAFSPAEDISLQHLFHGAMLAAFHGKETTITDASTPNSTLENAEIFAEAAFNLLKKKQEEQRLEVVNETDFMFLLWAVCSKVLEEYNTAREREALESRKKRKKTNEKRIVNLFDEEFIKNSELKHTDPNDVLYNFTNHLNDQMRLWTSEESDRYFAGCTALFQSAGMGKTHLIFETMKTAVFGVYLCFRRSSDNLTYPPVSPVLEWLLESETESSSQLDDKEVTAMPRFLYIMQATEQIFVTWFNNWVKEHKQEPAPQNWMDEQKGSEFDFLEFQEALLKAAQDIAKYGRYKVRATDGLKKNFVFFIDEGRTLMETGIFRNVRNCFCDSEARLRCLKPFGVFTDTLSALTKTVPEKPVYSSSRFFDRRLGELFPPFYFVNSLDISVGGENSEMTTTTTAAATLSEYGRPLWKTYEIHLRQSTSDPGPQLLQFAESKLLRSTELLKDIAVGAHRKAAAIACLACRAALRIYPGRRLATELVGCHMAVCSHVYDDRETILIGYPSEPLLARASRHALNGLNKDFSGWEVSLDELQKAIEEAEVDTSKIGELIHRMVLLLAIDMACARAEDEIVSLYDFLRAIVGERMINDVTKTELEGKYVSFNHFLPVYYVPDASKFQGIANRRAATVCMPGQNGISHEVPLIDKDYNVVGTLVVVTKNVASKHDSDYPASAGWKMSREFALHGSDRADESHSNPKQNKVGDFYFALYHNIGYHRPDGKPSFECKSMEEARDVHEWTAERKQCHAPKGLEIVGLDLPLFESMEGIRDKLKKMCDQGSNPIAHLKDSTDLIQKMQQLSPLAYR